MNVLFLTLVAFESLSERNIYTDLLREFVKHGHHVYAISPTERRENIKTHLVDDNKAKILRLQIGNTQKTNIIEKGISTVLIEPKYKWAIRKFFSDVSFDLVLYSTPPITLLSAVKYVKRRDNAKTYLMLKDIFPQNAVDIGMMKTTGLFGLLYRHFRNQEIKLYSVSDRIGCMSMANVDFVLKHNKDIDPAQIEVCPNSIDIIDKSVSHSDRNEIRVKYGIPLDKKVYIYGGNLGKPQGIPFVLDCLKKCSDIQNAFFIIIGNGTEYGLVHEYIEKEKPKNVKLMSRLPKEDYDTMVGACDIGLIFLDHRFTIPNFPSRLLAYMQAKLPVLACTDPNTDIGRVIEDGEFGWWCESDDPSKFAELVEFTLSADTNTMGEKGFRYLQDNYSVDKAYRTIMNSLQE